MGFNSSFQSSDVLINQSTQTALDGMNLSLLLLKFLFLSGLCLFKPIVNGQILKPVWCLFASTIQNYQLIYIAITAIASAE